ncbi:hypothetical protein YC2023_054201 [Brassica napus]
MEATVECSLGQSPVEAIVCVESSRFLLTGYVNLEPLQTAIVGIIDFSNFCMNGKMDLGHLTVVTDGNRWLFLNATSGTHLYFDKETSDGDTFVSQTKTNLRKLVTEEMLQSDGHNSIIIVDGANMIGWPEKMIDDELEIVRNAGVVQLQREIPHSINIQVAKVCSEESSCAGHLTWKESIPQSLMSYWIQLTSCNIMKLSSVA